MKWFAVLAPPFIAVTVNTIVCPTYWERICVASNGDSSVRGTEDEPGRYRTGPGASPLSQVWDPGHGSSHLRILVSHTQRKHWLEITLKVLPSNNGKGIQGDKACRN